MGFASRCFRSLRVRPTFWAIFPWSPLWRISKNGRFWCLCQIGHSSEWRALLDARFAAECCPIIALKDHSNYKRMGFASSCLRSQRVRPPFWRFSLGPPFEEFQKMADFGAFAKLAKARSCEQFWMRGLRQNVVRWLHFNRIIGAWSRGCSITAVRLELFVIGHL